MTPKPTAQDIAWLEQQIAKEEQQQQPAQSQSPGWLQTAADFADKYINKPVEATRLPSLAGGLLQGTSNAVTSAANLPLKGINAVAGTHLNIPYADLSRYLPDDPISRGVFMAGNIGGQALAEAPMTIKLIGALGKPNLMKDILAATGVGYAAGGSQNNDNESRIVSALLSGIVPSVGLASGPMAKRISGIKQSVKQEAQQNYNNIFDSLKDAGLHDNPIRVPSSLASDEPSTKISNFFDGLSDAKMNNVKRDINNFVENPTFENAHQAQSSLGKANSKLFNSDNSTAKTAGDLQDRIRGAMQDFLLKNKRPDLLNQYINATQHYAENVVPFNIPEIAKYQAGKMKPSALIKALQQNPKFVEKVGANIPGFGIRTTLDKIIEPTKLAKAALLGGAGMLGAGTAYKLGMPWLGSLINKTTEQ